MPPTKTISRTLWVDYLRSFITVLVVVHHAALSYTTFARFDTPVYINSTHAVVDEKRWIGLDIGVNFNDIFFMFLMFFIGGLFLVKSIKKKSGATFIQDRFYRLFLPFILGGTLLILVAYYPSYYLIYGKHDIIAYIKDFFIIERWPVGPPWFIWVLFLFNILFALAYPVTHNGIDRISHWFSTLSAKPWLIIGVWILFTFVLYVPIAYKVGAGTWTGFGPFDFQLSRILVYFGYFMFGVIIGNSNFNDGIFAWDSGLVKNWKWWVFLCLAIFCILTIMSNLLRQWVLDQKLASFYGWMIYYTIYVTSCVFSCIACIICFKVFVRRSNVWWDSLSENAYMIYLVHFVFVTWCQFLLLPFALPAVVKFVITFLVAITGSWMVSILIRKQSVIAKYV